MRFHSSLFDCQRLCETFRIDPNSLGLVATDMTGFHHLGGDTATGSSSYYFQCFAYKFIWSYDHQNNTTRAIAFVKNTEHGLAAFADLLRTAEVNQRLVTHPLYLALSGTTQVMTFMDSSLRRHYDKCHMMESTTGLRPWRNSFGGAQTAVHELNEMLQEMSALIVEAGMFIRRVKQWIIAVDAFERLQTGHLETIQVESAKEEVVSVSTAILLIRSRLVMMEIDFNYVRERAQGQCSTISHTMTRDDTLASIKLASIATRDSSSMKVIAIMTMAFLPGAFFATLFAVPSLHWNEGNVVGDNFWVYWAFVLPSTTLIFVLWGVLAQKGIVKHLGLSNSTDQPTKLS
ncbi:hypothetical protein EDB81DRAFT_77623 [Dactylonectria macrodidyma]|uniref:Uncharacterized protein n=1 Tax=Dactylonectria macrodidyma TaxID=307937 RepID=A0A9P9EBK1_9HYPO|nr:hypothetical protein EDB81DRAFT_77623 [Dactylonectria macrodidyma]